MITKRSLSLAAFAAALTLPAVAFAAAAVSSNSGGCLMSMFFGCGG